MRIRLLCLFGTLILASGALAQRPQVSPGVGNAVLLATNSILIDRDCVIVSGDVVVNNAASGPALGDAALSLGKNVMTPAGYKLAARSISIVKDARVGGDVYYNTLTNDGTIVGSRFTPLALPVYATLPPASVRPAAAPDVTVPNFGVLTLDEGAYGNLIIGMDATLRLRGGGYAFRSISVSTRGSVRYAAPSDVVVSGRVDFGNNNTVMAENGSGLTSSALRIQADGLNGTDGRLQSNPPAMHVGQSSRVFGTLYATAGSLIIDQSVEANGAFLARDIWVQHDTRLTINGAFNSAPAANSQTVSTSGATPLLITLTGSDPDGGALTFSIPSGPSAGSLTAPVSTSATSANVTYTPAAASVADSFTFRVRDPAGATGDAVVTINPSLTDPATPNPTTVIATDTSTQTAKDVAATLLLRGTAPAGVSLTFSIVASTGPFHGTLGAVTQGSDVPQRSATVVYTPDAGFTGADSFQFQACGVVSSVNVCDSATFGITVQGALVDPPKLAHDLEISTIADSNILISLGDGTFKTGSRRLVIRPQAAFLDPAEVAGNVADANGDGLGDNANNLPGAAPVFMSAAVNQVGGGPGSNGTVRMQFEWSMSSVAGSVSSLQSAEVILPTHRGTIDSLDTQFYWVAASGDGNLSNADYQSPAEAIKGAVMTVPATMAIGSDGTFSFGVLDQIRASAQNGFSFFAIQGRVNEGLSSPARGLEVRTTASGNISSNDVPMLALATPGVIAPLLYRITSLPVSGILLDGSGNQITTVPFDLASPQVTYQPNTGFLGSDTFGFEASIGTTKTLAVARITVFQPNCLFDTRGCYDGR